ncbi:MAG: rhodanese-related sulfurtransferase [Bdellovibrionota bacterium]
MKKEALFNKKSRQQLIKELSQESFSRWAASFYRYIPIENPQTFRDDLYRCWSRLGIFGRIYVAREGINAQFCVPEHRWDDFLQSMETFEVTRGIFVNRSNSSGDNSFLKLEIRVRNKIVADGLEDDLFQKSSIGTHLSPEEFHARVRSPHAVVVDVRNDYECETGKFEGAITPESTTFKDVLPELSQKLQEHKDKDLLLYCTGGIRCEKASAYFKKEGYKNVFQLQGGIINYLKSETVQSTSSNYKGSIFVFDGRMAESPLDKIASCHQCGAPHDVHRDCSYTGCHSLMVQCPQCEKKYQGCCSEQCLEKLQSLTS